MGFHLAKLLSYENHDIALIDMNQEVLDYANSNLDVFTIKGDSSSISILKQADVARADLILAVTTSEKTNLITAIVAKKMGAKQTVARVSNLEYSSGDEKINFQELGVDSIIVPRQLAATEIFRLIKQCSLTDIFDFENGKISLIGITLDGSSPITHKTIAEVASQHTGVTFKPIAILRNHTTIIPSGKTYMLPNDHIYFITPKEKIHDVVHVVGKEERKVKKIMIIGGSAIGLATARLLEDNYDVTVVEKDKERCKDLAEQLHKSLIIKGDPSDIELLREEGLSNYDAFIAVTDNTETNILTSLIAKDCGVYKTIANVDNMEYIHISQNIGVDTLINKKLIAANNIFRYVRKGKIEAITGLHGVDAEVIEFVVQKNNRLTRTPIKELHLPPSVCIGGVIRGNKSVIPDGDFTIQVDDKVIVFAQPEAIRRVEKLFR